MMTFKCKMCGGELSFEPGASVAECPYCGTNQTLPKLDDDKRANLYDRANHFRRQNEYDKAAAMFEQILAEDRADAEAYWSLVLCRYGIEYVEDPTTHKRVPTVNRAQYASILADEDYKAALENADAEQRELYEREAAAIAEIQKGILDISRREEPFDVFICYKETDDSGKRIRDSVLAQEIYFQLVNEGYKVFFSRITLEDKLGQQYEPYIFAALNSAKVMLVIGTKPEYFNAVWVKNEWSRFLALARKDRSRAIIPCYRDMDPYDLPEELSFYQSQDMSKIGFIQDLIRGIQKIVKKDEKPEKESAAGKAVDSRETEPDALDRLERLQRLFKQGVIDEVTYTQQRQRLLNSLRAENEKAGATVPAGPASPTGDRAAGMPEGFTNPAARLNALRESLGFNAGASKNINRGDRPGNPAPPVRTAPQQQVEKPIRKKRQIGPIPALIFAIGAILWGIMEDEPDTWTAMAGVVAIAGVMLMLSAILSGRKDRADSAPGVSLVVSILFIAMPIALSVVYSEWEAGTCYGVLFLFGILSMIISIIAKVRKRRQKKRSE